MAAGEATAADNLIFFDNFMAADEGKGNRSGNDGGSFSSNIDSNCRAIGDSCSVAPASIYPIAGGSGTRTSRCGMANGVGSSTRSSISGSGSGSGGGGSG